MLEHGVVVREPGENESPFVVIGVATYVPQNRTDAVASMSVLGAVCADDVNVELIRAGQVIEVEPQRLGRESGGNGPDGGHGGLDDGHEVGIDVAKGVQVWLLEENEKMKEGWREVEIFAYCDVRV